LLAVDHALYLAIANATGLMNWRDWPPPLREREASVLDEARRATIGSSRG